MGAGALQPAIHVTNVQDQRSARAREHRQQLCQIGCGIYTGARVIYLNKRTRGKVCLRSCVYLVPVFGGMLVVFGAMLLLAVER